MTLKLSSKTNSELLALIADCESELRSRPPSFIGLLGHCHIKWNWPNLGERPTGQVFEIPCGNIGGCR